MKPGATELTVMPAAPSSDAIWRVKPISAALAVAGVFDVAKEGGGGVTFAVGANVYWDDTNNVAVATDGAGANKLMGKAVAAAADADTSVRVRLSQ